MEGGVSQSGGVGKEGVIVTTLNQQRKIVKNILNNKRPVHSKKGILSFLWSL